MPGEARRQSAMNKTYVGHLAMDDPLLSFFQHDLKQEIEGATDTSSYRVFKLNGTNDVYLYEDRATGKKLVGKFFRTSTKQDAAKADSNLMHEFNSLCMMRDMGLAGSPHNVAKPLGINHALNSLLITECLEGKLLSEVILDAIHGGDPRELYASGAISRECGKTSRSVCMAMRPLKTSCLDPDWM